MRNPIHHLSKMSLHEAAHAVIARALGIDLDGEVCMRTGDKDTSAGVTTVSAGSLAKSAGPEAQIEGYEKDAKVALAAPIAQERLFPVGDEAADDIARAQTAIGRVGRSELPSTERGNLH